MPKTFDNSLTCSSQIFLLWTRGHWNESICGTNYRVLQSLFQHQPNLLPAGFPFTQHLWVLGLLLSAGVKDTSEQEEQKISTLASQPHLPLSQGLPWPYGLKPQGSTLSMEMKARQTEILPGSALGLCSLILTLIEPDFLMRALSPRQPTPSQSGTQNIWEVQQDGCTPQTVVFLESGQ